MALQDTLEPVFDPEMQAIWEQFEAGARGARLPEPRNENEKLVFWIRRSKGSRREKV